MNGLLIVVVPLALAVAAVWAIVAVKVGKPPRSRRYIAQAGVLGALAGLAPISAVLFLRLSFKACVVLNVFSLPWAEPWREVARWGAAAVCVATLIMLVLALGKPELQRAGIAMLMWLAIIAIPTFLLLFLTIYGDPGADCVPA